tara:strand:- start:5862 stop:6245 length:384 start_codon:yes stop_codon:yes gene_type:complete
MAKKNLTKTDTLKKAMLSSMEQSLGIVTSACKAVNISRDTHYRWMKEDEIYNESINSLDEMALDFAESSLHRQIRDGITSATIFYLKCKGRKRGYIEKQEFQIETNKMPDFSEMSTEEMMAILKDGK